MSTVHWQQLILIMPILKFIKYLQLTPCQVGYSVTSQPSSIAYWLHRINDLKATKTRATGATTENVPSMFGSGTHGCKWLNYAGCSSCCAILWCFCRALATSPIAWVAGILVDPNSVSSQSPLSVSNLSSVSSHTVMLCKTQHAIMWSDTLDNLHCNCLSLRNLRFKKPNLFAITHRM